MSLPGEEKSKLLQAKSSATTATLLSDESHELDSLSPAVNPANSEKNDSADGNHSKPSGKFLKTERILQSK